MKLLLLVLSVLAVLYTADASIDELEEVGKNANALINSIGSLLFGDPKGDAKERQRRALGKRSHFWDYIEDYEDSNDKMLKDMEPAQLQSLQSPTAILNCVVDGLKSVIECITGPKELSDGKGIGQCILNAVMKFVMCAVTPGEETHKYPGEASGETIE